MNDSSSVKLCECGCGRPAPIAIQTVRKQGWVKGQPKRFIRYHNIKRLPVSRHNVNGNGGYCECGCGEKTRVADTTSNLHGTLKGAPVRFRKAHALRKSGRDYAVDADTGCWIWQRATVKAKCDRYGQTWHEGRKRYAHRVCYKLTHGPIPNGWQVHHLCVEHGIGTTLCVNPEHLIAASNAENACRSRSTKLTPNDVVEILHLLDTTDLSQREIAEGYGIHPNHVSSINTGHRWG